MACSDVEPQQMRYRLLACNYKACDSTGGFACPWRGKTLTCLKNDEVSIYEFGEHASGVSSPKKKKLTGAQIKFCRELTIHHPHPMRIRHAMARKFDITLEELPELVTAQNFERGTFGWDLDRDDKHIVGDGSDERPFVIGLTTKALVQRLMVPPESFIMHVDTAYKMNFREYPVLVVGMSDRSRGFHLVALFIVSQERQ
ncbi:hypothetical protein PR001_g4095 [Phytophthora rubi]|uniref:MULE transposase domain-containing protein n=1 Tax=Phytophthora rubi TaxID=129364 RepID=A0A6A3NQJ7_9STRA|nr:hypothetical protein PR001_g4095 [Phytophthora rubi]